MSSANSSPDFEVLSTTSEGADETLDVRRKTNVQEQKDKQIKSAPEVSVSNIQLVPVLQQAIAMPAEVYEALIQRVAVLEKELNELKIDVVNRTLVRNVPVVVSETALSKGIEREDHTYPDDDLQDWGNHSKSTQSTSFSTGAGRQHSRKSTFDDRSDYDMTRDSNRIRYHNRYDNDGFHGKLDTNYRKTSNRYDDVYDENNRREYARNEISRNDNVRTSTQKDWKSHNDREYRQRKDFSEYEERYKNPSNREYHDGASSSRHYRSQDSLDQSSYLDNDRSSNYASHTYNSRNNDDFQLSNSQYERTAHHLCVFCKGRHIPDSCPEVTHYRERREILLIDGRCEICLSHHSTARCSKRKIPCKHCNDREEADLHHYSICPFKHY